MNRPAARDLGRPVLETVSLTKKFPVGGGMLRRSSSHVHAVTDVSLSLARGQTLGLVGESGCGKSTLARMIARLTDPTSGQIIVDGTDVSALNRRAMRQMRRKVQLIFQDPYSSLNPRIRAGDAVEEPLINFGWERAARRACVTELFARVGLRREQMDHYPHEFSGGQRQRLGIARALALRPDVIICDEPVSALDVSVQAQIINLLVGLQEEFGISYLFVAHDLAVVEHISHQTAVMYLGRIVESGDTEEIFSQPKHPYTQALLAAVPKPDPARRAPPVVLEGDVPSPINPPSGCAFHERCRYAQARCRLERPELRAVGNGHSVACHFDNLEMPS